MTGNMVISWEKLDPYKTRSHYFWYFSVTAAEKMALKAGEKAAKKLRKEMEKKMAAMNRAVMNRKSIGNIISDYM